MTLLAAGAGPPPPSPLCAFEQLYSSASDREKKTKKPKKTKNTTYNKHQNTIDMQDYQAVTCV